MKYQIAGSAITPHRSRRAAGWLSAPTRRVQHWQISASGFPRPRPWCCRPAIAWRFTPRATTPAGVPTHQEVAAFLADFHGLRPDRTFSTICSSGRAKTSCGICSRGREPRQHGRRRAAHRGPGQTGLRAGQRARQHRPADEPGLSSGAARRQARRQRNVDQRKAREHSQRRRSRTSPSKSSSASTTSGCW